eukprot:2353718-Rhodomonas_salina.5
MAKRVVESATGLGPEARAEGEASAVADSEDSEGEMAHVRRGRWRAHAKDASLMAVLGRLV